MSRNYFQHSTNYKTLTGLRGGTSEQRFDTSLLPSVTDTYDIGSGTLKWQEVFANKIEAIGGESRFSEVDVTGTMRTEDLIVTGNTTYNLLSANDANIANLDTTDVIVRNDLTVLGQLNYTLPPAAFATFGTLSDVVMGDLVTDPLDATPPEAANSNLQPEAERVLSAPTINATQWISTPFLTLMGLAQTDKLKVTSDKIPASKTDFNNTAFWNEGGAILQGKTYIDAECIPQTLTVIGNASVGGSTTLTGGVGNAFTVTGDAGLPVQNNTGNAFYVGGQGSGNSGRVIIGDGTGWEYRFANRVSSTTNDVVKIRDNGNIETGVPPADGSPYGSVNESMMSVQSTHPHTTSNHSGTLMLLDNSPTADNVNTGKGGSVVFAGPYADVGSNFYGAAGRIRGLTANGAYGGELTFETADTGGSMNRRATIDLSGQVGIGTTTPGRLLDVAGVARSTQMEVTKEGSNLTIETRKRRADVVDGWTTLDPNGGDNSLDNTGVAVWGSFDVGGGNFRSLKTGDATTTTSAPNLFAGGIGVAAQSVMQGLRFPSNSVTEYGWSVAGKETNAGRIGYGALSPANSQLDIIGAGTTAGSRSVKIWDKVDVEQINCTTLNVSAGVTFRGVNATEGFLNVSELGLTVTGGNQTIDFRFQGSVLVRVGTGTFTDTSSSASAILTAFADFASSKEYVDYDIFLHNVTPNLWRINLGSGVQGSPILVASNAAVKVHVLVSLSESKVMFESTGEAVINCDTVNCATVNGNAINCDTLRIGAQGPIFKAGFTTIDDLTGVSLFISDVVPGTVLYRLPSSTIPGDLNDQLPTASSIISNISGVEDSAWYVHFIHGANFAVWNIQPNTGIQIYGNPSIAFNSTRIALFRVYITGGTVDVIFL